MVGWIALCLSADIYESTGLEEQDNSQDTYGSSRHIIYKLLNIL
jgi:hypothetical protein